MEQYFYIYGLLVCRLCSRHINRMNRTFLSLLADRRSARSSQIINLGKYADIAHPITVVDSGRRGEGTVKAKRESAFDWSKWEDLCELERYVITPRWLLPTAMGGCLRCGIRAGSAVLTMRDYFAEQFIPCDPLLISIACFCFTPDRSLSLLIAELSLLFSVASRYLINIVSFHRACMLNRNNFKKISQW